MSKKIVIIGGGPGGYVAALLGVSIENGLTAEEIAHLTLAEIMGELSSKAILPLHG
jgi:hypothetical protein